MLLCAMTYSSVTICDIWQYLIFNSGWHYDGGVKCLTCGHLKDSVEFVLKEWIALYFLNGLASYQHEKNTHELFVMLLNDI